MLNIVLMGPPGAGKGTHALWIAKDYGLPHISTGDMFREAMASGSELGNKIKAIVNGGGLVSDDLTCALVKERLSRKDCENGYLLDGFPRTIAQAEALKAMGPEIGRPVTLVVDITVPDEVLVERIAGRRVCPKCGASYNVNSMKPKVEGICDRCGAELIQRKDDNPESFKIRLDNYYAQTAPLVDFYKAEGLYHHFDGMVGLEKVTEQVSALLKANQ
jgi:adenylate kinase